MSATPAADILAFWREAGRQRWYAKDDAFDADIRARFGALHAEASAGALDGWASSPEGALALVIVLDQFSRNLFRGEAGAFAQDGKALAIARRAVAAGWDRVVEPDMRRFFIMPYMHSEAIGDQDACIALSYAGGGDLLPFARDHERIVRRFGRFPHRNAILGRHTSPAEANFLDGGGFAG